MIRPERPECAIKGCTRGALAMFFGKLTCGECIMKFYNEQKEGFWKSMEVKENATT